MTQKLTHTRESSWLARTCRQLFYVDLRSLAALRICLGLVILADLASRSRHLVAHYTDLGVAPREVLAGQYGLPCFFSVHYWLSGSPVAVALLFIVNGVAALLLVAGWRTRLTTFVCWYLLASLIIRNPLVTFAGDRTLQLMLFWSLFLPLGARWSMDRRLNPAALNVSNTYVSMASLALLLQICFIYWFSAGFKMLTDMWSDGDAIAVALSVEALVKPTGLWIARFDSLLPLLTACVLNFEIVGPFLPFIPGFTTPGRLAAVTAFLLMHLTFALCFNLGVFPFMSAVAWVAFIPTAFWDRLEERFRPGRRQAASPIRPTRLGSAVAAVCLGLVVALNVRSLPPLERWVPAAVARVGHALRLTQTWGMFTTEQIPHGWFVVPGRLADGREVDLLGGGDTVPWERPALVTAIYPSSRWIQLLHAYPKFDESPYWSSYAAYLCWDWNRRNTGPQRLQGLSIGYMYVQPSPAGPERLHHIVFLEHSCL